MTEAFTLEHMRNMVRTLKDQNVKGPFLFFCTCGVRIPIEETEQSVDTINDHRAKHFGRVDPKRRR